MEIISLIVGLFIGIGICFLFLRSNKKAVQHQLVLLEQELQQKRELEQHLQQEKLMLATENERLKEQLKQAEEKLDRQKQELGEIRQIMADQFRNLANEILEDKSKRFTETNRENIEKILQPLNKDIEAFRQKVDEAYHKELN